ncbi:hypothetical protein OE88DRAFT_1665975 [Heliocybe sulcata]|uniref:Oxidase ustYa n=1 Tax=Heliocybe sulcata TaxID=5364 RepID=A0A5C3N0M3_9AGAM|nr:hypothetical protein OE88DRAFT_1665975 [Heliocybe sulcata]
MCCRDVPSDHLSNPDCDCDPYTEVADFASRLNSLPPERSLLEMRLSIAALVALNLAVACFHTVRIVKVRSERHVYSYIGADWPNHFDIAVGPAEMTYEETARYPILGPGADAMWTSLIPETNRGYVRLGSDRRVFVVAMFHQLHCLDEIRRSLVDLERASPSAHFHHCMNYLRQHFLCKADTTLEPYDSTQAGMWGQGSIAGFTRECRDWSAVHEAVERNYVEWLDFFSANQSVLCLWDSPFCSA